METFRQARDAFEAAAQGRGWAVHRVRDSSTFCRIVVSGPEDLLVDLALDSAPSRPSTASVAGPTFGLEELAGRKVIALFDRAEARDFADVYVLAQRYDKRCLLAWAAEVDAGFSLAVFADMTGAVARFADDELPVDAEQVGPLREFFAVWATELRTPDL
ncbi:MULTISPECIES: nucleotidyl transferase AbiEii/AbiGii toxin family protein [unclassified Kribbella]|uniref:nucleotidyl transferase AbiEii/AbiGii toxin family protein n=1 Tax=unclassified Kribbella TaxID=2644121 RepID=UPI003017B887